MHPSLASFHRLRGRMSRVWYLGRMLYLTTMLALAQAGSQVPAAADATPARTTSRFAAPEMLEAGGEPMGRGLLYPSPELRDMNGDGHADIVIGDLLGDVRIATCEPVGDGFTYAAPKKLDNADGQPLKFNNW